MTRARYPMIEELRHRFEAHRRRYGRLPRSWMLNARRWSRLKREVKNPHLAFITLQGVTVSNRPIQIPMGMLLTYRNITRSLPK